jgi:uncharacterized membrane protein
VTVGLVVVAGAALFEAALIPGVVIGGAAALAPRILPKFRQRLRPLTNATSARRSGPAARPEQTDIRAPQSVLPKFAFGQAIAKTITFRIIVTSLDFTVNFVVIGELGTAAALSTFNMIAGPLFYLGHEAVWNYLGPVEGAVDLASLTRRRADAARHRNGWRNIIISRALAKTITFRTLATLMDFATNYVVVRDMTRAVILSSSGFILGPFVYYGHEWVWDHFTTPRPSDADLPAAFKLLPAPG